MCAQQDSVRDNHDFTGESTASQCLQSKTIGAASVMRITRLERCIDALRPGGGREADHRVGSVQPGEELRGVRLPVAGQRETFGDGAALREHGQVQDLVDPVGARPRPRHQVPAARLKHQAVRLEAAVHVGRGLPPPVADPQRRAAPDRIRDGRQEWRVLGLRVPAGCVQVESPRGGAELFGEGGRQRSGLSHHAGYASVAAAELTGRAVS